MYNSNLRQMPYDGDIDINITNQNVNSNTNTNMNTNYDSNMMMGGSQMMGMTTSPIVETPRERCVYRNIYHEVPQV